MIPLRVKLVLVMCLPLSAVYLAMLAIEYRIGKQQAVEQMQDYLAELVGRGAASLEAESATVAQVARSTCEFLNVSGPRSREDLDSLLRANLRENPRLFGMCAALEPGVLGPGQDACAPYVCRNASGDGLRSVDIAAAVPNYKRWDWYLLPQLLGQPAWTDPYFDEGAGNILMCTYSVPLMREGKFQGVVTADISLEHLRRELAKGRIPGGYCTVVSRSGTFVSHPDESLILAESIFSLAEWHDLPELADAGREMIAGGQGVARIRDFQTRRPKWLVFAPIPSVGWSVAAVLPEEDIMAVVRGRLSRQTSLLLAGLGLIVILILVVAHWITRPLERLAAAAREVARGNLQIRVQDVRSRDEIGQFADTFNQMIADLKANLEATIRETSARQAIEKEMQVARQIQTSLLPRARPPFPDRREFSLDADNEPARFMAGDFFDYWFLDEDWLALVIADVSGKGAPAAMFMAVARTTLRNFSLPGRSPGAVLAAANRALAADNEQQMFVTIFYAHYHVRTGELVFANAGHNPPYLVGLHGRCECIEPSTGPLLGIWPDAAFEDRRTALAPGDLLLLYTDGVTEAANAAEEMFGDEGLKGLLARIHAQPVDEICRTILREVNDYRRHEGQDDVTVLALRRSVET